MEGSCTINQLAVVDSHATDSTNELEVGKVIVIVDSRFRVHL